MDGVHDLGGVEGFGPVIVEANEPVFHAAWESRVFGLVAALSVQRIWNVHTFRHAIERMDPVHYLDSPYYEHWLTALATLLAERGVVTPDDLTARAGGAFPLSRPLHPATTASTSAGAARERDAATTPRFAVGDTVVVRNVHPHGHTRCPRYVRGKRGVIVRQDGVHALPDVAAHGAERCKQHTYSVRFDARELWGGDAGADVIHVDLWEGYLDAV
jgi:nitrile hydratase